MICMHVIQQNYILFNYTNWWICRWLYFMWNDEIYSLIVFVLHENWTRELAILLKKGDFNLSMMKEQWNIIQISQPLYHYQHLGPERNICNDSYCYIMTLYSNVTHFKTNTVVNNCRETMK